MNLKIFPATVTPDGRKLPLVDRWAERATSDPAQIQQWVEQFGERIKLWGIPTGSVNGIYALDIDVKGSSNGFESLKNIGITQLPNTAYQQTSSGGMHLLFKYDPNDSLRNTVSRDLGIDGRSEGGWIAHYGIHNLENIQPVPEWVKSIVRKPINQIDPTTSAPLVLDTNFAQQEFWKAIEIIRQAQEGERNQKLNTAAYLIGKLVIAGAVSYEYAYQEISKAALSIGLDPVEIQATSISGLKGGAANPLTHPFGDKPPVPVIPIEAPILEAPGPRNRWTPRYATLEDMTNWTKLKRPQLFKDWAPRDIILTSAVGGVGKSTIKLYEAICLALGEPFLGFECVDPGKTLMIIGEDSAEKMYAMMGKICKDIGLFEPGQEHRLQAVRQNVVIKLDYDLPLVAFDQKLRNYSVNHESLEKIKEAIDDLQPKHIVFDPINIFGGSEAGGNDSAKAMMQAVQKIRDMSDAAVELISHVAKDAATRKETGQFSARGATSIANHSRVVKTYLKLNANEYQEIMGEVLEEGLTAIQCFVSKFSDGSPILDSPFIILREGYLFSRKSIPEIVAGPRMDSGRDMQRVLDFIRSESNENNPLTESVIADHFRLSHPKIVKTNIKAILGMLVYNKVVEKREHIDETIGEWFSPYPP